MNTTMEAVGGVLGTIHKFTHTLRVYHITSGDISFANEMAVRAAMEVYTLYNATENLRIVHRPGNHHGFVDIETYFDWFDRAFDRRTPLMALAWSGPVGEDFPLTFLTPAGFDINTFVAVTEPPPPVPPVSAPLLERVEWVLGSINSSRGLSSGAVYSEEMDECSYISTMMDHDPVVGGVTRMAVAIDNYKVCFFQYPSVCVWQDHVVVFDV